MKIAAIAVDDFALHLKALSLLVEKVDFIDLRATFTDPFEALAYLTAHKPDLIFLDIEMKTMSGMEFCRQLSYKPSVIFTTAHNQYAVDAFSMEVLDYLMKPITPARFEQAMRKVSELHLGAGTRGATPVEEGQPLIVKVDYGLVKIQLSDILFVEGLNNYMKIHSLSRAPLITRFTRKALLGSLPARDFMQVHRSYIVSLSRIERVRNKTIYIAGKEIPIGESFEALFLERFTGADR